MGFATAAERICSVSQSHCNAGTAEAAEREGQQGRRSNKACKKPDLCPRLSWNAFTMLLIFKVSNCAETELKALMT